MANKKKSILEEAILDAKRIQEALNANTKEILRSVAKEEIESLVKESIEEDMDYMEEDVDEDETEVADTSDEAGEEIELDNIEGDDEAGEEEEIEAEEEDEIEVGDIDNSDVGGDLEGDYETGMDAAASDNEIEMDMTTASDDDVIAVYKKLTGDDEIEVVVDDEAGEVKLKVSEPGEFVIKMDDEGSEENVDIDIDSEMDVDSEEVVYDIALEDEDEIAEGNYYEQENLEEADCDDDEKLTEEEACDDDEKLTEEENLEEADCDDDEKTLNELIPKGLGANGKHGNPKGIRSTNPPIGAGAAIKESATTKKYNALLTEAKELKGKNGEYKQALKQFRTMLAETVVFNSNLTYVTKLFMEHSTTKNEKEGIFKRFDNEVSTLKESKKLYRAIASELGSRKPINESINNKIEKEVNSGTSKQLNESTVYVDTETSRIMDLIKRVDKK